MNARVPRIRKLVAAIGASVVVATVIGASPPAIAAPGNIVLASIAGTTKGDADSFAPSLSGDGTKVAFWTVSKLVPGDTDAFADVYVKDLTTGKVILVSTGPSGKANADSFDPSISADGTRVAFVSSATNLDPADTDDFADIYVKVIFPQVGLESTLASTDAGGTKGNDGSLSPSLNADGTRVAFVSFSTNLDPADTDTVSDIYVKDLPSGDLVLASTTGTTNGNGDSTAPSLNAEGLDVAFASVATNFDPADTDAMSDIYIGRLDFVSSHANVGLISTTGLGTKGNGGSFFPSISAAGSEVAFQSVSTNLDPADTDPDSDIFFKSGATVLVSSSDTGANANAFSFFPSLSADASSVSYQTAATNLDPDDSDSWFDVYVKDLLTGDSTLSSTDDLGAKGNGDSQVPSISADGTVVAFQSGATNLDPADTDTLQDVYVKGADDPVATTPVASDDDYTTDEGVDLSVAAPGVLGNDTDPNGDVLAAQLSAGPSDGQLTLNADGSFRYEPDPGFSGTDSFTYVANDGAENSNVATVTITVTPTACTGICLSIGDVSVTEGNQGTVKAMFTVSLSGPSPNRVTVLVEAVGSTATPGIDYAAVAPKTVSFKPGETTQTVFVPVKGERAPEADETFLMRLSASVNAGISDGQGVGTILNDD